MRKRKEQVSNLDGLCASTEDDQEASSSSQPGQLPSKNQQGTFMCNACTVCSAMRSMLLSTRTYDKASRAIHKTRREG
eukprot:3082954-Amphidinium_carterae.1